VKDEDGKSLVFKNHIKNANLNRVNLDFLVFPAIVSIKEYIQTMSQPIKQDDIETFKSRIETKYSTSYLNKSRSMILEQVRV